MRARSLQYEKPCSIHALPNELLIDIFEQYAALDDSPWRLTLVCTRWQQLAMSTSFLWTHIVLRDGEVKEDEKWRIDGRCKQSRGRASVCQNVGELEDAIHMAGVILIHLTIDFKHPSSQLANIEPLIRAVFRSSITNRILELNIDINPQIKLPADQNIGHFSDIKAFRGSSLPPIWAERLFEAICFSSTSLYHLKTPPLIYPSKLDGIIPSLKCLEQLEVTGSHWPKEQTPTLAIVHVRDLTVTSRLSDLGRLDLVQLQSLAIQVLGDEQIRDYRQITLPNLITLNILTAGADFMDFPIITPKLRALTISTSLFSVLAPTRVGSLSPNLFLSVESLNITIITAGPNDCSAQDSLIILALRTVPNAASIKIKTVSLMSRISPVSSLQYLERLASNEEEAVLCPNLRDLTLVFGNINMTPSRLEIDEIPILRRISDARRKMHRGLRRFVTQWTEAGGNLLAERDIHASYY